MDPIDLPQPENPARLGSGVRTLSTRAADALSRHNPFYLLSAMSMLAACLLLANSLSWSPIPFTRLLALLGILNVYELLLLGLGLFLLRRGRNPRDSSQLLFLAAVFLADAAFLNSEVVTHSLTTGLLLNVALLLFAVIKFVVTSRFLGIPLDAGRVLSVALLFTLLFGLPAWLKTVDRSAITGVHLYACWWAATLAAAAYDLLIGRAAGGPPAAGGGVDSKRWGLLTTLFIVIPTASLLTHIGILHYVYNEPFTAPHAAPILLLLAIVLGRVPGPIAMKLGIPSARHARTIQALLPIAAVMISSSARFTIHLPFNTAVSPFAFTAGAAVLTYALTLFRPYAWAVILSSLAAVGVYLISPSAATISLRSRQLLELALSLIPSTRIGWGVLSLITAFALLALGARISIRRPHASEDALPPSSPTPEAG